jgi:hypothetical protein
MSKFEGFTYEQSVDVLLEYAHHYAFSERRIMDRISLDRISRVPKPHGPLPKTLRGSPGMLECFGDLYGIDFADPENEEIKEKLSRWQEVL